MENAYLIHGTSTRDDDWFPWLEEEAKPIIALDRIKRLTTKLIPKTTSSSSLIVLVVLRHFVILNVIMLKMLDFYWWEHLTKDYQLIPN